MFTKGAIDCIKWKGILTVYLDVLRLSVVRFFDTCISPVVLFRRKKSGAGYTPIASYSMLPWSNNTNSYTTWNFQHTQTNIVTTTCSRSVKVILRQTYLKIWICCRDSRHIRVGWLTNKDIGIIWLANKSGITVTWSVDLYCNCCIGSSSTAIRCLNHHL